MWKLNTGVCDQLINPPLGKMPESGFSLRSCIVGILNMNKQFVLCQIAPNLPFHVIVAFIVPVLLNSLQLKYQGNACDSAFEEHPITVLFATGCLLVYCLGYAIELAKFSGNAQVYAIFVHRFNFLFGSLSVASLASMIFPSSIRIFLYGICIIVSVDLQLLFNTIEMFINSVYVSIRSRFLGTAMRNRGGILPVFNHNSD